VSLIISKLLILAPKSLIELFMNIFRTASRFVGVVALLLITDQVDAQSIVGRWKRISNVVEKADGSQQDLDQMMKKYSPCITELVYTFVPDGTLLTDLSACDADRRKAIESTVVAANKKSRWSQSGSKVTTTMTDNSISASVHIVRFSGNTMTWQFNFADNPNVPNPTKARTMTIVYQRI